MSRIAETFLPGHYGGTSRDAAESISASTPLLRERVFAAIRAAGADGLTPDECSLRLGVDEKAVRPRFTELGPRHANRIVDTGFRRANESGHKAKAWRAR